MKRILIFGDTEGVRQSLAVIPPAMVCGVVAAEIRPQYHRELQSRAADRRIPLLIQPLVASSSYPEFVGEVEKLAPDLIFVNSYSMLVRPDVLSVPPRGAINVHMALLPEYRGCNPIQWALLNGETETGVTMHYMSPEFDAGDIIAQRRIPIFFGDTWCSILSRLQETTERLLREELPRVFDGTNARQPQDPTRARYYRRRHPEDGQIEWDQSVRDIYNLIRALVHPNPGAFYQSPCGRIIVDQYLPISAVAALKYGAAGGRQLSTNEVSLTPVARVAVQNARPHRVNRDNHTVVFVIHGVDKGTKVGTGGLTGIDYEAGTAELWLEACESANADRCVGALGALLAFAVRDLGLRQVTCQVGPEGEWLKEKLEQQGFVEDAGPVESGYPRHYVWEERTEDGARHVHG
jgi:methionyl-tRNA formyltransferase